MNNIVLDGSNIFVDFLMIIMEMIYIVIYLTTLNAR